MYWPIGPAKAYEQRLPTHSALRSNDGVDALPDGAEGTSQTNGDRQASNGSAHGSPEARRTVNGSHRRGKSQAEPSEQDDGYILDLAVSRAGHIFATITRTTLTVWQTRVLILSTNCKSYYA